MNVKIFDLERDHKEFKDNLIQIFEKVLSSGEYILGKEGEAFEYAFASYTGVRYGIGVGNGTDAIRIGGLACGVKAGDKIVTTPNTYIASAMALTTHGLIPFFCDIEPDTYNIDPERLEDLLKKERGIRLCIPVHLYGHPSHMDEVLDICKKHNVKVLEDACQAHGTLYKGKKTGSLGDAAAFSFYPTKNLGCYGDGGMVVTNSPGIYNQALMLRNYGQTGKHIHTIEGFNSRLDEVQAAILRFKLGKLDEWNERRRHIARVYFNELKETPLKLPHEAPWAYHVYHLFVVRTEKRDELMNFLREKYIATLIHYPTPIHLQHAYSHLGYTKGTFPVAEKMAEEILSLPMYPSLREEEVLYICEQIRTFYKK